MTVPWQDDTEQTNVVWQNTLDQKKFHCVVTQPNAQVMFHEPDGGVSFDDRNTTGRLVVTHVPDGTVLLDEAVEISHGAIFGPDTDDLVGWQGAVVGVVDKWYTDHGMVAPSNS